MEPRQEPISGKNILPAGPTMRRIATKLLMTFSQHRGLVLLALFSTSPNPHFRFIPSLYPAYTTEAAIWEIARAQRSLAAAPPPDHQHLPLDINKVFCPPSIPSCLD